MAYASRADRRHRAAALVTPVPVRSGLRVPITNDDGIRTALRAWRQRCAVTTTSALSRRTPSSRRAATRSRCRAIGGAPPPAAAWACRRRSPCRPRRSAARRPTASSWRRRRRCSAARGSRSSSSPASTAGRTLGCAPSCRARARRRGRRRGKLPVDCGVARLLCARRRLRGGGKGATPVIAAVRSAAADGTWPTRVYVNVNLPDAPLPGVHGFPRMEHACGRCAACAVPLSEAGVVDEYVQQSDQLPPGGDAAAWEQDSSTRGQKSPRAAPS